MDTHLLTADRIRETTSPEHLREVAAPVLDHVRPVIDKIAPHHRKGRLSSCATYAGEHRRGVLVTGLLALAGAVVAFLAVRRSPPPTVQASMRPEPAPTAAAGSDRGGAADRGAADGFGGAAVGGTAQASEGPFGAGSAAPLEDGSAPGAAYTIKGDSHSKVFHTRDSSAYDATRADVWFVDVDAARAAGFEAWTDE